MGLLAYCRGSHVRTDKPSCRNVHSQCRSQQMWNNGIQCCRRSRCHMIRIQILVTMATATFALFMNPPRAGVSHAICCSSSLHLLLASRSCRSSCATMLCFDVADVEIGTVRNLSQLEGVTYRVLEACPNVCADGFSVSKLA